mmetsp:Transcript_65709/g.147649  ORF Transcript_65709/g.147649 Transcript_65709/m.147649 type:complete len:443 (-) Transcript_65709:551-1879(-)
MPSPKGPLSRRSRSRGHIGLNRCRHWGISFLAGARIGARIGTRIDARVGVAHNGVIIVILHIVVLSLALARLWDWALAQGLAHIGEEPLRLLVHLLLACLGLLQQSSRISVLRIHFDHALAILDALDKILEAVLRLGAPVQGLRIRLLILQHSIASSLGLCVVLKFQVARGLVELAYALQLLGLELVLLLEVVDIAEEVHNLLIALQSQLEAAALEESRAHAFSLGAECHLVLLGHVPRLLDLLKILQFHGEHYLGLTCGTLQAELCLCRHRGLRHGEHGSLAFLHLCHGAFQGIADIAIAHRKLQHLGGEAGERAGAVGGCLHRKLHLRTVLGRLVAFALLDLLLHDGLVLIEGDILRLVQFLELQGDGGPIGFVGVRVVFGALELHLLALLHLSQGLVASLGQGSQDIRAQHVLQTGFLLYDSVRGNGLEGNHHLVAVLR